MERKTISVNLCKIKINDIKTAIFLTTFIVIYFNADNNKYFLLPLKLNILMQITTRPSYGLLKIERRPIFVNLRKIKINDIKTVIF